MTAEALSHCHGEYYQRNYSIRPSQMPAQLSGTTLNVEQNGEWYSAASGTKFSVKYCE